MNKKIRKAEVVWTRKQIKILMLNNPTLYRKLQPQIMRAYREGRIVGTKEAKPPLIPPHIHVTNNNQYDERMCELLSQILLALNGGARKNITITIHQEKRAPWYKFWQRNTMETIAEDHEV